MASTKVYTPEQIIQFSKAINEDAVAYEWLKMNKCPELAAACCFILHDSQKALDWLKRFDFRILWSFSTALDEEEASFQYLMQNRGLEWAATVCVSHGNTDALNWLLKNRLNHFAILAKALYQIFES